MTLANQKPENVRKAHKASSSQLNRRKIAQSPNMAIVIIALFFYIYSPPIHGIPIGLDKLIALSLIVFWKKSRTSISKGLRQYKAFVALLLGSIVIAALHDIGGSHSFLDTRTYNLVSILLEMVPAAFIFSEILAVGSERTNDFFIKTLIGIGLVQSIICAIMYASPVVRSLVLEKLLRLGIYEDPRNLYELRGYGMSSGYFFSFPLLQSLIAAACIGKATKNPVYLIILGILILPIYLNARIGYIVFPCYLVAIVITLVFTRRPFEQIGQRAGYMIKILAVVFFAVICSVLFIAKQDTKLSEWNQSALNEFTDPGEQGDLSSLATMIVFPQGAGMFFGNGIYCFDNPRAELQSDIGYINDLMFGGLLFVFFAYGAFAVIMHAAYQGAGDFLNRTFVLACIFVAVVGNMKGILISGEPFLRGFVIIMIFYSWKPDIMNRHISRSQKWGNRRYHDGKHLEHPET